MKTLAFVLCSSFLKRKSNFRPFNNYISQYARRPITLQFASFHHTPLTANFSEVLYHKISNNTLDELADALGELDNQLEDVDINLSQGVLTVNLGPNYEFKTWVINKQTPNRQIWWSSPLSGPRRYEYIGDKDNFPSNVNSSFLWRFSKDESVDLFSQFREEIFQTTGVRIAVDKK